MTSTASRSVLAPLTTTFTPPPACSTFGASGGLASTETYWQAQSCRGGDPHDDASCWPPVLAPTPTGNLGGFGFYSPGLHCPVGYYSACTGAMLTNGSPSPLNLGTSFAFTYSLTAGETGIGCCPEGLTCSRQDGGGQTCGTVITTGQVPNIVGFCPGSASSYYTGQNIDVGIAYTPQGDNSTTISLATASLFGPLVQIVFKSTDISSLPSPTTAHVTLQPVAISSGVYGNTNGSTTESAQPQQTTSQGLPSGAKIGIGVGVPLAVLLVAALAAFIFLRRKRRTGRGRNHEPVPGSAFQQGAVEKPAGDYIQANYPPPHGHQPGGYQGHYAPGAGVAGAVDNKGRNIAEAPNTQRDIELDATPEHRPIELADTGSRAASP